MSDREKLYQQLESSRAAYEAAKESEQFVLKMAASYRKRRQMAYIKLLKDFKAWQHQSGEEGKLPVDDMVETVLKAS